MSTIPRQTAEIDPLAVLSTNANLFPSESSTKLESIAFSSSIATSSRIIPPSEPKTSAADVLELATNEFLHKCRTSAIDPNTIVPNPSGIQLFARAHAWEYVVNASAKLITSDQPGFLGGMMNLVMMLRLEGLFRMKMFDELLVEANRIIAAEDIRLKPYFDGELEVTNPLSCDLSIAIKLLVGEVKAVMGRYDDALEQLYTLRSILQHHSITSSSSPSIKILNAEFWIWKIRNGIINAAIRQRQWRIALSEMMTMIEDLHRLLKSYDDNQAHRKHMLQKPLILLYCRLSRVFLQMGNIDASIDSCKQAEAEIVSYQANKHQTSDISNVEKQDAIPSDVDNQVYLARALLQFADNNFQDAMESFSTLLSRESVKQRNETMNAFSFFSLPSSNDLSSSTSQTIDSSSSSDMRDYQYMESIVTVEDTIFAIAANNYAICALNLRRIKEAVGSLEKLIQEDPARYMNDALVFNICTLYDLSCPPEQGALKKKVLHAIATMYHITEPVINWKSYRLT